MRITRASSSVRTSSARWLAEAMHLRVPLVCLFAALVACGCAAPNTSGQPPSTSAPQQSSASTQPSLGPKRLTAAIQGDPFTVYQKLNLSGSVRGVSEIQSLVHAGLTVMDTAGQLHPELAEAVPTVDNGLWQVKPDGSMVTTWKIRAGAEWQNGVPLQADDFVFTMQVVRDPTLPAFRDLAYSHIKDVAAADPQTVVVNWSQPFIRADQLFSDKIAMPLPKHLLESAYMQDPVSFTNLPYWSSDFVGLGPYMIKEFERSSHVLVQANDRFVLGRPKIDEIDIQTIPDANAIVAALLAGTVDVVFNRTLSLDQAVQLRDRWPDGTVLFPLSSLMSMDPQMLNPTPAVVGDLQFRRAVLESIDRQQLADGIDYGLTPPADGILDPSTPEYKATQSAIVKYPYDPRQAAQAIESLGYTKAADGLYHDASGE